MRLQPQAGAERRRVRQERARGHVERRDRAAVRDADELRGHPLTQDARDSVAGVTPLRGHTLVAMLHRLPRAAVAVGVDRGATAHNLCLGAERHVQCVEGAATRPAEREERAPFAVGTPHRVAVVACQTSGVHVRIGGRRERRGGFPGALLLLLLLLLWEGERGRWYSCRTNLNGTDSRRSPHWPARVAAQASPLCTSWPGAQLGPVNRTPGSSPPIARTSQIFLPLWCSCRGGGQTVGVSG